jgi:DNA-binding response OmpR family regulator
MTMTRAESAPDVREGAPVRLLVYSDDSTTRAEVMLAVGRRAAADLPRVTWTETATHAAVVSGAESGTFTALILDGEAAKVGGLGICRQLKAEVWECPPIIVLIGRPEDAWLAAWSEADAVVCAPLDPVELQRVVARVIRERLA